MNIVCCDALYSMGIVEWAQVCDETAGTTPTVQKTSVMKKVISNVCNASQRIDAKSIVTCKCPIHLYIKVPSKEDMTSAWNEIHLRHGEKRKMMEFEKDLKDAILKNFVGSAFNICKTQTLKRMKIQPMTVELKDKAHPVNIDKAYLTLINLKDECKHELEVVVALGIIEPVPTGKIMKWCTPMLAVPKKLGRVRHVLNFKTLNKNCKHAPHITLDKFRLAMDIPRATEDVEFFFSTMDIWNVYHSVPLTEDSRN
jgi:hypothetical protein